MIIFLVGTLILLFHLTKGVCYFLKGAFNLIAPFFSERLKHKKTPQYEAHCKKIDELFNSIPTKTQRS